MAPSAKGAFRCTFDDCYLRFDSLKMLHHHKIHAPEHDYCDVCDLDFADWEAHNEHKVQVDAEGKDDLHICCRYCGQDFKTRGGRDRHIQHAHPIEQKIPCRLCELVFPSPSALVFHLEEGMCKKMGPNAFYGLVQHKMIVKSYLANPHALSQLSGDLWKKAALDDDDGVEGELGGVSLNLMDEGVGPRSTAPVIVPVSVDAVGGMPTASQRFPALGDAMKHIKSQGKSKSNVASVAAPVKKEPRFQPIDESEAPSSGPWIEGSSSRKLFPKAKPTPVDNIWELKIKAEENNANNILYHQFWNPDSKDYDPSRFYHPILELFKCPIPSCSDTFQASMELTNHLYARHRIIEISCPVCHKQFSKYHIMISHFESNSQKCGVQDVGFFERLMADFTGGFVSASMARRPDAGHMAYFQYEGSKPKELKEEPKGVTIGGARIGEQAKRRLGD